MLNYSSPEQTAGQTRTSPPTLSSRLKALSDPTRLTLLDLIVRGVQCNCELGSGLGAAPNLISHHLSVLRRIGLIDAERDPVDARWIYYTANRAAFEELRTELAAFFSPDRIQPRRRTCGPRAEHKTVAALPLDRASQRRPKRHV